MSEITAMSEITEITLASRRRRFFAICIDIVLTAITSIVLLLVSGLLEGPAAYIGAQVLYRVGMVAIFAYLIVNGYLLVAQGQSIGKFLTKIRIISIDSREALPLWHLYLRSVGIVFLLFVPPLGLLFIGIFVVDHLLIFGKLRRCGHDLLFGSRVVNN